MKQKSIHSDTRQEMFRRLLKAETEDLQDQLRPSLQGKTSTITEKGKTKRRVAYGEPVYAGGANRKRVRALARAKARDAMKRYRAEEREAAA